MPVMTRNRRARLAAANVAVPLLLLADDRSDPLIDESDVRRSPRLNPEIEEANRRRDEREAEIAARPMHETCSICLEEVKWEPYGILQRVTASPCDHAFHRICLTKWTKRSDQCPLCRASMTLIKIRFPEQGICDDLRVKPRRRRQDVIGAAAAPLPNPEEDQERYFLADELGSLAGNIGEIVSRQGRDGQENEVRIVLNDMEDFREQLRSSLRAAFREGREDIAEFEDDDEWEDATVDDAMEEMEQEEIEAMAEAIEEAMEAGSISSLSDDDERRQDGSSESSEALHADEEEWA